MQKIKLQTKPIATTDRPTDEPPDRQRFGSTLAKIPLTNTSTQTRRTGFQNCKNVLEQKSGISSSRRGVNFFDSLLSENWNVAPKSCLIWNLHST